MELKELFDAFSNATEPTSAYIVSKMIIEALEKNNEEVLAPAIKEMPLGDYVNEDLGRKLSYMEIQKASIDSKAADELSESEIRKVFKLTEKGLKDLQRKDLLEKYRTVSTSTQIRVTKLEA